MRSRHALIALGAVVASAGCRAMSVGAVDRPAPPPVAQRPSVTVQQIIADHNRNAEKVERLEARPTVNVQVNGRGGGASQGRMALERPRNFKLELSSIAGRKEADLGSNDKEFWFWVRDSERKIYVGDYDVNGSAPATLAFQPDWIIEALGLREVPPEEEARLTILPGKVPNTLVLNHQRSSSSGTTIRKVTVVDRTTRRVLAHHFYGTSPRMLLASAYPSGYADFPLPPDAAGTRSTGEGTAILPQKIKLVWYPSPTEPVTLDVTLNKLKIVDQPFETALFSVPDMGSKYEVVRLNEQAGSAVEGTGTRTYRDTRPAPPVRVQLNPPVPIEVEGAIRTSIPPASPTPSRPARTKFGNWLLGRGWTNATPPANTRLSVFPAEDGLPPGAE